MMDAERLRISIFIIFFYFHRIGKTFPGPPPKVEVLDQISRNTRAGKTYANRYPK